MPELRTDSLTGRSVIIAAARDARPNEYRASPPHVTQQSDCPFCAGHESQTPAPLYENRNAAGEWMQRVVPNKYPFFGLDSAQESGELSGGHEVIIESRRHLRTTGELSVEELANVLGVYAARLSHWRRDGRFPFRMVFKNVGASGGASLSHLHSQLVATSSLSQQFATEARNVASTNCPSDAWSNWLEAELTDGTRLVDRHAGFLAFCPRVSRAPYETWLMPSCQSPLMEESLSEPSQQKALAELLQPLIVTIESRIAPAGYNMMLHTAPGDQQHLDWYSWRIEIVPRVASLAGFELGTGVMINTIPPEAAADDLRNR